MCNETYLGGETSPSRSFSAPGVLRRWRDATQRKKNARLFEGMPDYLLYDIGLTRGGVHPGSRHSNGLSLE